MNEIEEDNSFHLIHIYIFRESDFQKLDYVIVIDETMVLKKTNIEKAYDACLTWLKNNDAIRIVEERPNTINAEHMLNILKNHTQPKYFLLEISQKNNLNSEFYPNNYDVTVNFKIGRPRKWQYYSLPWYEYVEELWNHISAPVDDELLRSIYPPNRIKLIYKEHHGNFRFMFFLNMIPIIIALVGFHWNRILASFFILFGILFLYGLVLPAFRKSNRYKNLIEVLYSLESK